MGKFLNSIKFEFLFLSILPELTLRVLFQKNFNEKSKLSKYAEFVINKIDKEYFND